ncbi:MAG: hypothetical protein ABUT20_63680 [Bacteroidota bacterium]
MSSFSSFSSISETSSDIFTSQGADWIKEFEEYLPVDDSCPSEVTNMEIVGDVAEIAGSIISIVGLACLASGSIVGAFGFWTGIGAIAGAFLALIGMLLIDWASSHSHESKDQYQVDPSASTDDSSRRKQAAHNARKLQRVNDMPSQSERVEESLSVSETESVIEDEGYESPFDKEPEEVVYEEL